RFDLKGVLEAADGLAVHLLGKIGAAEIVVREVARLVAAGAAGFLEPWEGVLHPAQLEQIKTHIVIRNAEKGIDGDRAFAFADGFLNATLIVVGPAEKGVSLGSRMEVKGRLIELDGALVVALHLGLIAVLEDFPGAGQGLLAQRASWLMRDF